VPSLAVLTAGHVAMQADSRLWAAAVVQLARMSLPTRMEQAPAAIQYSLELANLPSRTIGGWNRTWAKSDATALGSATIDNQRVVLSASRRFGSGHVIAAAFSATAPEAEAMAALVARPPRDPRFKIVLNAGASPSVIVDAVDGDHFLNDLDLKLSLTDPSEATGNAKDSKLAQIAPGRYRIDLPVARWPKLATLTAIDHVVDRFAMEGRYATEFSRIGNNRETMRELALRTRGAVIEPTQTTPIELHRSRQPVLLASTLACVGAGLIALGLIVWKLN
jgi:hypothetical protein